MSEIDEYPSIKAVAGRPEPPQEVKYEPKGEPVEKFYEGSSKDNEGLPPSLRIEGKRPVMFLEILKQTDAPLTKGTKADVEMIDKFINDRLKKLGYKDDKKSYQELLEKYLKKADCSESLDLYSKAEKLSAYLKIIQKAINLAEEEELFNKKDWSEMSASEMRRKIKQMEGENNG